MIEQRAGPRPPTSTRMPIDDLEREHLKSEIAALRLLLEVNETSAIEQARRADHALETVRVETAVRLQQANLIHQIIEASTDAVLVLDSKWELRYVNHRAVHDLFDDLFDGLTGGAITPQPDSIPDLIGSNLLQRFPEIVPPAFYERYKKAMVERVPVVFEDYLAPRDRWLSVSVSPVGAGIAIFIRNVTERRQRDAALHKAEKLAAVGRLASSISHEINNPLESVVNLLYLIEHATSSPPEMKTYASLATSELARVSHIVTQTLKFHRQATDAAECRISEILESVISLFQGRMATRHVAVARDYAPDDIILCFAGDMRQVFANLIGNAIDAMPIHGELRLRTRRSRDWRTGRDGLRVIVADNGSGMSRQTLRNLFEPFFTTKPTTGTGLGLWVSEEIVRSHKGSIRPRSSQQPGRSGTTFNLFFPAAPPNQ
jgi:signal transduction histidine kinase